MTDRSIIRIILPALVAHILLSWPLWYQEAGRSFPFFPLLELPLLTSPGTEIASLTLFAVFTLWSFIAPQNRTALGALLAIISWMIFADLNRLQPWLYFYLLSLVLILFRPGREKDSFRYLQWLVAAVYAWSGLNKITPYFAVDNFPWFCEAFTWTKTLGAYPEAGYGVAVLELLFAPGLIWGPSRAFTRWTVVLFHLFIGLALSPLGLNWNQVVIPWNLAMAAMVWVLFRDEPGPKNTPARRHIPALTVLLLAWIMPVFNIFHHWDEALSWKMYSNTQTEVSFYSDSGAPCPDMEALWSAFSYNKGHNLLIDDWAMADIHVPAYNSRRTHQQIASYLCSCLTNPDSAGLLLLRVERWDRNAEQWERIPCRSAGTAPR